MSGEPIPGELDQAFAAVRPVVAAMEKAGLMKVLGPLGGSGTRLMVRGMWLLEHASEVSLDYAALWLLVSCLID